MRFRVWSVTRKQTRLLNALVSMPVFVRSRQERFGRRRRYERLSTDIGRPVRLRLVRLVKAPCTKRRLRTGLGSVGSPVGFDWAMVILRVVSGSYWNMARSIGDHRLWAVRAPAISSGVEVEGRQVMGRRLALAKVRATIT